VRTFRNAWLVGSEIYTWALCRGRLLSPLGDPACPRTDRREDLRSANTFVVAVPTPVDETKRPDLELFRAASEIVGEALSPGALVVYESTVYPGATEEVARPILERVSGLRAGRDFDLGYSPERVNPGDRVHTRRAVRLIGDMARIYQGIQDAPAGAYLIEIPAGPGADGCQVSGGDPGQGQHGHQPRDQSRPGLPPGGSRSAGSGGAP